MRNFTLTQLIKPEVLQQMQDAFSDYTGMAAITTNADGVPVTKGSNFINFCTNVIRGTEKGLHYCQKCDKQGAEMTMKSGCPAVYRCHAGLVDFAAPIIVEGHMIGCFVGGQVLTDELDEEFCHKKAMEYGIDLEIYLTEAKKAFKTTPQQVERSAKLISDISKALSSLAVHSFSEIEKSRTLEITARSQSDHIMKVITDITEVTGKYIQTAKEAVASGDPEKMRATLEQISVEGSGTVGMIRDSMIYLKMIGKNFRMNEVEYDPHIIVKDVVENIRQRPANSNVDLSLKLSESLPHCLLGDAGSMCQIIDKIISLSVDHGGRNIEITISSEKRGYAEQVFVHIVTDKINVTDEQLERVNLFMKQNSDFSVNGVYQELGLPLARSLLRSMSGEGSLGRHGDGAEYCLSIPQLKVKGGG